MREMCSSAFDIQETSRRRVKCTDLIRFINRQAKTAADPLFGTIKDADEAKSYVNVRMNRAPWPKGSSFAVYHKVQMKSHLKLAKTPLFILVVASKSHVYTVYVYIQYILYDILYCEKQRPFTECQNVKIIR